MTEAAPIRRVSERLRRAAYRARARRRPLKLMEAYRHAAATVGLDAVYLVVSFDCDTIEDACVVEQVAARLLDKGVRPVYAVPGMTLVEGRDVYRALSGAGAEFLNHGGMAHTERIGDGYESRTFYDRLSWHEIEDDVMRGHQDVLEVTGIAPIGFRTPHFGTFQNPSGLRRLHSFLLKQGYRYSSSTMPWRALRDGPISHAFALPEFPVSGMARDPLTVLDSWNCFAAPDRRYAPRDYFEESRLLCERYRSLGVGIINVYADPSHIHNHEEFFEALDEFITVATPVTYSEILARTLEAGGV